MTALELISSLYQLEFSLLALRDDPLPALKTQLEHLEQIGNHSEASQVFVKINNENSKRERWDVRCYHCMIRVTFMTVLWAVRK